MNFIDEDMILRFREVPETGTTLTEPLTGWRVESLENGRMLNAHGTNELRAKPCKESTLPLGIPSPLDWAHEPPHPRCECGLRIVGDIRRLSHLFDAWHRIVAASGMPLHATNTSDQVALCRVEATGFITRGHDIPSDDPRSTIRAGHGQVTEIYTPPWVDTAAIARNHPWVPIRPITGVPGDLFSWMRTEEATPTTLAWQSHRHHIRVRTGVADIMIPRTHLQPPAVREAILNYMDWKHVNLQHERTIINRLVVPLTDLTDPLEMIGCARGIAVALVNATDAEVAA